MAKKSSLLGTMFDGIRAARDAANALNHRFDISGSQKRAHQERSTYLWSKYRDPALVEALLARRYWVGQHLEHLKDSLGPPTAIDQKNMATRNRQIWKYYPTGVNRYQLRITIDDGIVRTWDFKDHE